jgi:hypothetical protein
VLDFFGGIFWGAAKFLMRSDKKSAASFSENERFGEISKKYLQTSF